MGRVNEKHLGLNPEMEKVESYESRLGLLYYFSVRSPDKTTSNEDSFGFLDFGESLLLVVADGLGGHDKGDWASRVAIEQMVEGQASKKKLSRGSMLNAIELGNKKLITAKGDAGTTLVAAHLQRRSVRFYSIGDSVGLIRHKNQTRYKTYEHSVTGLAVESGLLSQEKAGDHPESHLLLNALGEKTSRVEMSFMVPVQIGDRLLLASDGLTSNLTLSEIEKHVSEPKKTIEAAESLVNLTRERMNNQGAPDDLTVLVFERTRARSVKNGT